MAFSFAAFLVAVLILFGRLRIEVDDRAVSAEFGYLGWPRIRVPLDTIVFARPVHYRPISQFGGWGIRVGSLDGKRTGVYSIRGDRGVLMGLTHERRVGIMSADRLLLGTEAPERLAEALGKPLS